ncbi:hypothetical protein T11_4151 [Trichinella zimbabwensis]|uniref:Apple domain-containing protein n=2 Tax=Trichinella zimbabwensis TaxID=268475 RepID=A0A0V1H559_9BILA|nr:hypothetical protein T11_4151 [Trichinella zimbabwensis]
MENGIFFPLHDRHSDCQVFLTLKREFHTNCQKIRTKSFQIKHQILIKSVYVQFFEIASLKSFVKEKTFFNEDISKFVTLYLIKYLSFRNKKMLTWQQCFLICTFVQLWQCEGMEYAAYLPDSGMTCVLDKQKVCVETFKTYKMKMIPNLSLQACIVVCNQLSNCIAVKHVHQSRTCYMFASKRNKTEKDVGPHTLTYVKECKRGSYFLSEIKNNTSTNTKIFFISLDVPEEEATYIVENRATVESIWAKTVSTGKHESLVNCLVFCNEQSKKRGCKAVIYNPKTMKCTLLNIETVSPPVSFKWNAEKHLFLLHLTVPWDLKVNSVLISTTHNMTYELSAKSRATANHEDITHPRTEQAARISTEAFVQLYRYMEVCKINVIHNGIIENVTSVRIIPNVRSINRCLHFCRPIHRQLFYCAVIYSRHNYKCELLKKNTERSAAYFVDGENNLIELLNCYPDRQSERRNNPPPMRYYFKETGEICVLEFYNLTHLSGFNLFEFLENVENIKSCIYACRQKYETHLCLAINYTMKKQCILFKKESTPTLYIVEPQSVFAEILLCEEGTLPCKSTLFAAYLNDAQMTCILDERKVNSSLLQSVDIQTVLGKSFEECITMCYLLPPEKKCNAIKYFQTLMKCYLFAIHINITELEMEDESFAVIYIYGCTKGSYYLHEIGNYSTLVFGGTFISLQARTLDKKFIIERRPIVDSMHSKILLNDQTESIVSCLVSCYVMRIGCNAVLYNTRAGWCTLLKHETPTLPVTVEQYESRLMFLLHLTLPWDVKVNTVVIKVTHNISYELRAESRATADTRAVKDPRTEQRGQASTVVYIHLYRYMEVCKVNVIYNKKIENVTSIQIISNVRSVNKCLHFCRPWLRQLFYCAIIYTRNTERSNAYFVDGENNLIELLNCYPDRQSERRNNPPPMRYYLKETGEICVLEFYNSTELSGFNPIEILENVENIKSCIYACRQRCHEDLCLAISYTTKKQCTLLRKVSYRLLYNVESQSLFAEILFCEPGTFVDEIYDF